MQLLYETELEETIIRNVLNNRLIKTDESLKITYEKKQDFEIHFEEIEMDLKGNIRKRETVEADRYFSVYDNSSKIEHIVLKKDTTLTLMRKRENKIIFSENLVITTDAEGDYYLTEPTDSMTAFIEFEITSVTLFQECLYISVEFTEKDTSVVKYNTQQQQRIADKYTWAWQNEITPFLNCIKTCLYTLSNKLFMAVYEIYNNDISTVTLYSIAYDDFKEIYKVNNYEQTVLTENVCPEIFLTGESDELYMGYSYRTISIYKFLFQHASTATYSSSVPPIKRHFYYSICATEHDSKILFKNLSFDKQTSSLYVLYVEENRQQFCDYLYCISSETLTEKNRLVTSTFLNRENCIVSNFVFSNGQIYVLNCVKKEDRFTMLLDIYIDTETTKSRLQRMMPNHTILSFDRITHGCNNNNTPLFEFMYDNTTATTPNLMIYELTTCANATNEKEAVVAIDLFTDRPITLSTSQKLVNVFHISPDGRINKLIILNSAPLYMDICIPSGEAGKWCYALQKGTYLHFSKTYRKSYVFAGVKVMTPNGHKLIDELGEEALILTADKRQITVKVEKKTFPSNHKLYPVLIPANYWGKGIPFEEVMVGKEQGVFNMATRQFVRAKELFQKVSEQSVVTTFDRLTYYNLIVPNKKRDFPVINGMMTCFGEDCNVDYSVLFPQAGSSSVRPR